MGFSEEWDEIYKNGNQLSVWPWTKLVSLVYHYVKPIGARTKVLEIGCGAGANIRFFQALGVDYYAIEGSSTMVYKLNEEYASANIHIVKGDFTKSLSFAEVEKFDLIVDRGALTHNATCDINRTLDMIYARLADDGMFIGVDWHSDKQTDSLAAGENIDDNTKIFTDGYYAGLGRVHFSNEAHLRYLLKNFKIRLLEESVTSTYEPKINRIYACWDFVASK